MKSFTNHTKGPRGINLEDGTTRWIEPGQTVEIDPKTIAGNVPDLGKPADASTDTAETDDLKAQVANLTATVEALTKERDDLKAQVAKFDPDGDGKTGGSKPAPK